MIYQSNFKRYELKYLLTPGQHRAVLDAMAGRMALDKYGKTVIRNIYFDTDTYRLARRSIERPLYKEKLRLRSYGEAKMDDMVFVELKKKYKSVVYKRRIAVPQKEALNCLQSGEAFGNDSQIAHEIEYFASYYQPLQPVVFLSYEREAYYALDKGDLRVTFDGDILFRRDELTLDAEIGGERLLPSDLVLMEVKTSSALPLWLTSRLSEQRIYKTSFSKYGTAYQNAIYPTGVLLYA